MVLTIFQETYKEIGGLLKELGDEKSAEEYYLKSGDWQSVVDMYRISEKWSEAYRVAKEQQNDMAQKKVAFLWAKSLGGGDAAVRLLERLSMFQETVDFACQNKAFEFAYELCRIGDQSKLSAVHLQHAIQLEDDGKYDEASEHYIKANCIKEAIAMYVHSQQWEKAEEIARCNTAL
uniref:Intraflagellar transport protein 172 homolog n=1 Tax=Syphacia muris TaxID=451379 RepID=A0A0N5ACU7_9BILA